MGISLMPVMESLESSPERRRGLRIRQHRPLKIFEPTTSRYFPGQTEDISTTGLRLELPLSTPVSEGHTLTVHVAMGIGESLAHRRQMLPARVVWTDRDTESLRGRMVVGVEFLSAAALAVDAA